MRLLGALPATRGRDRTLRMGCPVGGGWRGEGDVNFDVALDVKESDLSPGGLVMIVDDVAKGGREGGPPGAGRTCAPTADPPPIVPPTRLAPGDDGLGP